MLFLRGEDLGKTPDGRFLRQLLAGVQRYHNRFFLAIVRGQHSAKHVYHEKIIQRDAGHEGSASIAFRGIGHQSVSQPANVQIVGCRYQERQRGRVLTDGRTTLAGDGADGHITPKADRPAKKVEIVNPRRVSDCGIDRIAPGVVQRHILQNKRFNVYLG